jgi:hypothetical protein
MDNIAGTPVVGLNFFGRDKEAATLVETLANDDVLLLGPRRIGKTSIARAVMTLVRAKGWRAIEINVASCKDERAFLEKLDEELKPELASLGTKIKDSIGNAMGAVTERIKSLKIPIPGAGTFGVELGNVADTADWTKVGSELLRLIGQVEQRWLIYLDELPIMLFEIMRNDPANGVQRVRRFLDWFRNDVRALPGAQTVRWLVSGSVGLDTLVQQHGMADTINSLNHRSLPPYSEPVAVDMLNTLATSYGIPLDPLDSLAIVNALNWPQPYYLQVAFNHLRELVNANPDAKTGELIESAVAKMIEPGSDNDFHHWEKRLTQQLGHGNGGHARALLTLAATDPTGARPEMLLVALQERMPNVLPDDVLATFVDLRDILVRDAYWWPDSASGLKRYRFRLEPLRRWWIGRNTL